ncbi:MAG: hypothetical protein AB8U43_05215, partial [Rickettsia aeschlimannii]
ERYLAKVEVEGSNPFTRSSDFFRFMLFQRRRESRINSFNIDIEVTYLIKQTDKKISFLSVLLDSRLRGNNIEHVFRAKQQRPFANDISKFIINSIF